MISANKIIGSLVYDARESLRNDDSFLSGLSVYDFKESCFANGEFNLWHYPATHNELSNILSQLGQSPKQIKYPAVFNLNPIRQDRVGSDITIYFNLAIIAPVSSEWLTQEREEQVFIPLLRPIYNSLIEQTKKKGYILSRGFPQHRYYEVFTTGDTGGVLMERYGDFLDAIELQNLTLTIGKLCDKDLERIEEENRLVTENNF